ncbi:major facilitator superfamily transport protein [Natrialba magadii ATCC 43099]|uniref:Major facilitator superfamily protein n=1 Tax=Natrialba magadii (strain ATCC 43099 / DSM 3394 / CCM 3739 / CIP 104546 / IAM 13178 / JCM 8861 / NBRC 102185 / NCIMB 2190 / MS3) TaxID=547559 RepID=D3SYB1_NATMM|nr:MFS transporter [Natrialba magadii]ADD06082.1 major facilitator superfamily transport protein [Natrialba magadii ATCC 43099]ELY30921.1 major facilitator superfamily protein [Natrialba magadii ATCC 43099]
MSTAQTDRMSDNDRSITGFVMISHAVVHTYELSIPILMVIWLTEFSVSTAILGSAVAVGYGLFGVGALPAGILVDRFGSRELVLVCLAGMGGSFLLLSAAQGIVSITLALCVWGIAASIYHPAGLSLISTGVEQRGTGFAYHGMAGNFGIAFGPLLTAILLLFFDWRLVTAILVVPAGLAILYALTASFDEKAAVETQPDGGREPADEDTDTGGTTDGQVDNQMSLSRFLSDSRALFTIGFTVAMVVVMMNGLFYRGTLTFLPDVLSDFMPDVVEQLQLFDPDSPMAEEFDPASYLYAGLLMVGMAGQYVGGKLTDRIRTETGLTIIFASLAVVAVLFVPVAEAGLVPLLLIGSVLGFLLFSLQPMYQATIAEYSPPGERGLSYGYTYLGVFGVGAAGAAIAGFLLSIGSIWQTFAALAVFPATGAVLAIVLRRTGDRRA